MSGVPDSLIQRLRRKPLRLAVSLATASASSMTLTTKLAPPSICLPEGGWRDRSFPNFVVAIRC